MKLEVFSTRDRRIRAAARDIERRLSREFGQGHVSVVLTSNRLIHALNRRFLGHDRPTDVMAFPTGKPETRKPGLTGLPTSSLGEVYVSRDQARLQARDYGVSYHSEVKRLMLHGVLHLLGLTHREMEPYYRSHVEGKSRCKAQNAKCKSADMSRSS